MKERFSTLDWWLRGALVVVELALMVVAVGLLGSVVLSSSGSEALEGLLIVSLIGAIGAVVLWVVLMAQPTYAPVSRSELVALIAAEVMVPGGLLAMSGDWLIAGLVGHLVVVLGAVALVPSGMLVVIRGVLAERDWGLAALVAAICTPLAGLVAVYVAALLAVTAGFVLAQGLAVALVVGLGLATAVVRAAGSLRSMGDPDRLRWPRPPSAFEALIIASPFLATLGILATLAGGGL